MVNKIILGLAITTSMIVPSIVKAPSGVASADYSSLPSAGSAASDSYVDNVWSVVTGARRVSDRSVMVNQTAGWGYRGKIKDRTFDISSFEISVDVTNISLKKALIITFGSAEGSYPTDSAHQLNFDILADSTDSTKYMVTCSNNASAHNTSISGFSDGQTWKDDANYTGVTATTLDHTINIKVTKGTTTSTITVNDVGYEVNNSDLYKNFVDSYDGYITLGTINSSADIAYQINYIGDASDEVYFGSEGAFTLVKNGLNDIEANMSTYLATSESTLNIKATFDALPYTSLYSFDKAYFATQYSSIQSQINSKIEEYGDAVKVPVLEEKVAALKTACASIQTLDDIKTAVSLKQEADNAVADCGTITSDAYKTRYDTAVSDIATCSATISNSAKPLYAAAAETYREMVDSVASIKDISNAFSYMSSIPSELLSYMSSEDAASEKAKVDSYTATLNSKTILDNSNYTQGAQAYTYVDSNDTLGLMLTGGSMGVDKDKASGLYLETILDATNFEMTINIDRVPTATGSWACFGLMEKPDMFVYADDTSTQDNKGIFFLLTRKNSSTISVQSYIITMTSTRFYDGALSEVIDIPASTDIKFSMKEVTKEIAGLTDTYYEISFGDQTLGELIKATRLRTIYGTDKQGYLMFSSNAASVSDPAVIEIKDINGKSPLADDLSPAQDVTPTTTDTSKSYQLGTTSDVNIALDTKDQTISGVSVDGSVLDASSYTYDNGTFTLKNAYLNTLTAGDHTVTITTAGGEVKVGLTIIAANVDNSGSTSETPITPDSSDIDQPDTDETITAKQGCRGSLIGTSALVFTLASGAGIVVYKRKKEENK